MCLDLAVSIKMICTLIENGKTTSVDVVGAKREAILEIGPGLSDVNLLPVVVICVSYTLVTMRHVGREESNGRLTVNIGFTEPHPTCPLAVPA